jgi:hypothetical protein
VNPAFRCGQVTKGLIYLSNAILRVCYLNQYRSFFKGLSTAQIRDIRHFGGSQSSKRTTCFIHALNNVKRKWVQSRRLTLSTDFKEQVYFPANTEKTLETSRNFLNKTINNVQSEYWHHSNLYAILWLSSYCRNNKSSNEMWILS